jgi:hypothetical protein
MGRIRADKRYHHGMQMIYASLWLHSRLGVRKLGVDLQNVRKPRSPSWFASKTQMPKGTSSSISR